MTRPRRTLTVLALAALGTLAFQLGVLASNPGYSPSHLQNGDYFWARSYLTPAGGPYSDAWASENSCVGCMALGATSSWARLAVGSSTFYSASSGWQVPVSGHVNVHNYVPPGYLGWADMYGYAQVQDPVGSYSVTAESYAP